MEMDVGVFLEPALVLLMGVEVVEDDVEFAIREGGNDAVHEAEELDTAAALGMRGNDRSGGDFERLAEQAVAVASPARINLPSNPIVKPLAFNTASVQPSGQPASISSALICSPVRPRFCAIMPIVSPRSPWTTNWLYAKIEALEGKRPLA